MYSYHTDVVSYKIGLVLFIGDAQCTAETDTIEKLSSLLQARALLKEPKRANDQLNQLNKLQAVLLG